MHHESLYISQTEPQSCSKAPKLDLHCLHLHPLLNNRPQQH